MERTAHGWRGVSRLFSQRLAIRVLLILSAETGREAPRAMRLKRSKYHARPTEIGGHRFASKKEAQRWMELQLLERAYLIEDLECQPVFPIHIVKLYRNGWPIEIATVSKYIADFRYTDLQTGEIIVEDVKGARLPLYVLKRKLVEAIHGITVREV